MIRGGRSRDKFFSGWTWCEDIGRNSRLVTNSPNCALQLTVGDTEEESMWKKVKGLPRWDTKKTPQNQNLKNPTRATMAHAHYFCHTIFMTPAQSSSSQCSKANMQDHQSHVILGPWWCCRAQWMALDGISWEPLKFSFRAAVTNQAGSTVTGGESYANVWVGYCSTGEKVLFQTC